MSEIAMLGASPDAARGAEGTDGTVRGGSAFAAPATEPPAPAQHPTVTAVGNITIAADGRAKRNDTTADEGEPTMSDRTLIRLDAQLESVFSFVSRPRGWFRTNDGAAFLLDWLRDQGWIVELRGMARGAHFMTITPKYAPIPNMTWLCLTSRPVDAPYEHGDQAFGEAAPIAVALLVQRLLQRRGELPIDDKLAIGPPPFEPPATAPAARHSERETEIGERKP